MGVADYKRACDICGDDSWLAKDMKPIGDGKYACPYDARGFHDADLRGKNLADLWPAIKPRKEGGREASVVPLYEKAEAQVLNLLLAIGGTGVPPYRHWKFSAILPGSGSHQVDGTGDGFRHTTYIQPAISSQLRVELDTCAWTAIYLYELLSEDRRSLTWITAATAKFREMADTLLANQFGSPTIRADLTAKHGVLTEAKLNWGGIPRPVQYRPVSQAREGNEFNGSASATFSTIWTTTMAASGMALLHAYSFFGEKKYQDGYLRVATWLQRALNLHLHATRWTTNAGGGRVRYPTWPEQLQENTTTGGLDQTSKFAVECLVCLEFLVALQAKEGDISIGSTVAVTEFASQPGLESISSLVAMVKAFWRDGIRAQTYQQNYEGTASTGLVSGFSADALYDCLQVPQGGFTLFEPYWAYRWADNQNLDQTVVGTAFAHAMRGWYAAFGFDPTLEAVWNYWMASTQAADLDIPTGTSKAVLAQTALGPYTPSSMGLTSMLTVQQGDFYGRLNHVGLSTWTMIDLSSVGLLADLWVARDPAGFALAKERACTLRRRSWLLHRDRTFDLPALMRYVGFSYQTMPRAITNHPSWRVSSAINLDTYNFATDPYAIGNVNERAYDACGAAMFGLAFRRQPKIYSVKDHPPRH